MPLPSSCHDAAKEFHRPSGDRHVTEEAKENKEVPRRHELMSNYKWVAYVSHRAVLSSDRQGSEARAKGMMRAKAEMKNAARLIVGFVSAATTCMGSRH
jgi:hypothetical protein